MNRTSTLTLLAAVVIGFFAWQPTAHAVDPSAVLGQLSQTQGLNSEAYTAICRSQQVVNALDQLESGYVQRVLSDLKRDLAKKLIEFAARFARCIATGGFVTSPGGGFTGASPCATDVGGAMSTEIKNQYLTKLRSDFLANCTARVALNSTLDTGAQIIAEGGRDGGPAFVQDWRQMRADSRYRGLQVARNQMANTDYCPWLRGPMAGYFNFDPGQGSALEGEREDGTDSYSKNVACSLPNGFDPLAPESQTTESLAALTLPTNSIWGSYLLAESNIYAQMAAEEQADEDEYVQTGGYGALREINPSTGTSCAVMATDGTTCLKYSSVKQPGGGVQAEVQAARQAQYDWVTTSREGNSMMQDVRLRMFSSLLDATSRAIDTDFQVDMGARDVIDNPDREVQPPPGYVPGGNPGGPGGPGTPPVACPAPLPAPPPDCICLYNDADAQALSQGIVLEGTRTAVFQQEGFLVVDGRVIPGQERTFLGAVCSAMILQGSTCQPSPTDNDQVIVAGFAIDIIGPDNSVLMPGRTLNFCGANIRP